MRGRTIRCPRPFLPRTCRPIRRRCTPSFPSRRPCSIDLVSFFHPFFRRSHMARTLTVCALLLPWSLAVRADDPPPPTETVIRLSVSPMPAAKPALRHPLLPELGEMNPGNPIQGYLKCFMEQDHFFNNKESV